MNDWDVAELDQLAAQRSAQLERLSVDDVDQALVDLAAARRRRNAAPLYTRTRAPLRVHQEPSAKPPLMWSVGFHGTLAVRCGFRALRAHVLRHP